MIGTKRCGWIRQRNGVNLYDGVKYPLLSSLIGSSYIHPEIPSVAVHNDPSNVQVVVAFVAAVAVVDVFVVAVAVVAVVVVLVAVQS